jgi:hypothetical protein
MARYLEEERLELLRLISIRKIHNDKSLERKFNKMDQYEFFCSCLDESNLKYYDDNTTYLYKSNYREEFKELFRVIYNKININKRQLAIDIVKGILLKTDKFIIDINNCKSIFLITEIYEYRLKDIGEWEPRSKSKRSLMNNLLHFLFAKYPVPNYLVDLFKTMDLSVGFLFHYIGTGKSLKTFPFIPNFIMGKKAYHHIYDTPVGYSYNESFRRAQIKDLGGDEKLVETLLGSRIGSDTNLDKIDKKREEFWVTVIKFFIGQDALLDGCIVNHVAFGGCYPTVFLPQVIRHMILPDALIHV